jgi:hypothetical protein
MATIEASARTAHAHHWLIDEPDGPVSRGHCKGCGAVKAFRNWIEEIDYINNDQGRTAA